MGHGLAREGDILYLLHPAREAPLPTGGAHEYVWVRCGREGGQPPSISLAAEAAVQALCREGILGGLIRSAHDLSEGGLAVALAEACLASPSSRLGARVRLPEGHGRLDARLFGEAASRILVSAPPGAEGRLREAAGRRDVALLMLGVAAGPHLRVEAPDGFPILDVEMSELEAAWAGALDEVFGA